jgi:hypothetical protein
MVPHHEAAEGWSFVVTGYILLEQSLKALLHFRGATPPRVHSLYGLFDLLDNDDKDTLREYYLDFKGASGGNIGAFPFGMLDDFLLNLDGGQKGRATGSFDWRYFLIEQMQGQKMPLASVDYLHEVVYGTNRVVGYAHNGRSNPSRFTYSYRLRSDRMRNYIPWLTVRMNSDGWRDLGDRLEILWGPDYRGRYDLMLFKSEGQHKYFSDIPDSFDLPVIDKRTEIETFDAEEGLRSIGIEV